MNNPSSEKIPFFHDPEKLGILYQFAAVLIIALIGYFIIHNTLANLDRQHISTGFGFVTHESSFEIGESLISYSSSDTYGRALVVGVLNTLLVSFVGIVLTLILGTFIGIARLSSNWLVSKLAGIYIEVFQDIPVLIQLIFWYSLFYEMLPSPRKALSPFKGLFLSNRGCVFAIPKWNHAFTFASIAFLIACVIVFFVRRWARKRQEDTGEIFPLTKFAIGIVIGLPFIVWLISGAPFEMNIPVLSGFNFKGGLNISPEFTSLLLGLVLYTAAFVAEVVRAGIQSVSKGQTEAAISLGLKQGQVLNLVVLPQAMRVIVPPLTSQMLNLAKNSSLAVAIGYPDFVSVCGTTINQTGQAIEGIVLIMLVYLCFSLSTSAFMNWYNKKIALVER